MANRIDMKDIERKLMTMTCDKVCEVVMDLRKHDPTACFVLKASGPRLYLMPHSETSAVAWLRDRLGLNGQRH